MSWLNQFMVNFLGFLHSFVNKTISSNPNYSYGLAIILMTIVIRVILFPLNFKQTKSTIKMNEIQPEVKKIQEKYKNDPQKSQQELMKLYKEKGASPLGGCLPILIQWPILIALYYAFNSWSSISGVGFLWLSDLSKPDKILAILSGATTLLTGLTMASTSADPAQVKQMTTMNIGMAIFITVMSFPMKSALVLYWVVGNLFTILQNLVVKRLINNKVSD